MTNCFRELFEKYGEMPIFFMSPKGKILEQKDFENFSTMQKMIILCGHYEGIDERIFKWKICNFEWRAGKYGFCGWSCPARRWRTFERVTRRRKF